MNQYKPYTRIQLEFIYKNKTLPHAALAAAFNKRFGTKKNRDAIHSLCTRKGWRTGRTGCFEKGNISWNTGTKGLTSANITSFKKGNIPANLRSAGSTRICSKDGYILVKRTGHNKYKWRAKQLIVWEVAHGKPKPGHVIRFKDGNKLNCTLDNLEEVSMSVNLYLNQSGYADLPEELKPSMMAVAKLECKTFALANG